jgi:2-methylcitrate dehydratase PrpD
MSDPLDESASRQLIEFACTVKAQSIPQAVRHQARRSFVDSIGCIVAGGQHALVQRATGALEPFFGAGQASLLGQGKRADLLHAALINGTAGAAYSYFDSYSAAHLHPGAPHTAALLALAEQRKLSGTAFLTAYACGLEAGCRITKAIALPPAEADIGWSIGGVVNGLAVALAAGRLLDLDQQQMTWALGIAASQAAGTRAELGTMTASLLFGQAAQTGLRAAMLAAAGFTSSTSSLGDKHGYAQMFSKSPNLPAITEALGQVWELQSITYKPFPTDIAIHPGIDAMMQMRAEHRFVSTNVTGVAIVAGEIGKTFCDRPNPANELDAKFSIQHWVAAVAMSGKAGLAQGRKAVVENAEIARLRSIMQISLNPEFAWDHTEMTIYLRDGRELFKTVDHCLGSTTRPMSDGDIEMKFLDQASVSIGEERARRLFRMCWDLDQVDDISTLAATAL